MRIQRVYTKVKEVMRENPEARDNDGLLTALVDIKINPAVADMPYRLVMANRSSFGLPPCESVRRARQRAQETTPGLASGKKVQQLREANKEEIEEFVRTSR